MEELAKSLVTVVGPAGKYILKKKLVNGVVHQNLSGYSKSNSGTFRVIYGEKTEDIYTEYLDVILTVLKAQR